MFRWFLAAGAWVALWLKWAFEACLYLFKLLLGLLPVLIVPLACVFLAMQVPTLRQRMSPLGERLEHHVHPAIDKGLRWTGLKPSKLEQLSLEVHKMRQAGWALVWDLLTHPAVLLFVCTALLAKMGWLRSPIVVGGP